jgi:hypothetical protein
MFALITALDENNHIFILRKTDVGINTGQTSEEVAAGPIEDPKVISQLSCCVSILKTRFVTNCPKSSMLNMKYTRFRTQHKTGMNHCFDNTHTR